MDKKIKKVVLAYSGGLDTSVMIHWLKKKYGCQVIAFTADVGYGKGLDSVKKRAFQIGAAKVYSMDLRNEFINDYAFPALKADAVYEGKYLLATALSRPLIVKKLVQIAEKEQADAVAHGCTGKGNDQVRFEVGIMAHNPKLSVLAPVREWEMKTREEEVEYAIKNNIPITVSKKKIYSLDANLWGISIECGVLEDPWVQPPEDAYQLTVSPENAPAKPIVVEIAFKKGIPVQINGKPYDSVELVKKLNSIGGANAIGRVDLVENRLVGIKSREIYEAPAATILHSCHRELENLVLDRETLHYKELIAPKYAELIYYGLWDSPLKEAFDGFIEKTQKHVTGTVRVKLYKGNCIVTGRKSPYSLYDRKLATYEEGDTFSHQSAKGFIQLWGLPLKVRASLRNRK
jgi:argininosuccinate synthase